MIHFNSDDTPMLKHYEEVMADRASEQDGYTDEDEATMTKMSLLARSHASLVVTGDVLSSEEAKELFARIVQTEIRNWVPNTSQRLLQRASGALGIGYSLHTTIGQDCGPEPHWHALVRDWVGGITVMRCVTCARLYKD